MADIGICAVGQFAAEKIIGCAMLVDKAWARRE